MWIQYTVFYLEEYLIWEIGSKDQSPHYPHKNGEQNLDTLEVLLTLQELPVTWIHFRESDIFKTNWNKKCS